MALTIIKPLPGPTGPPGPPGPIGPGNLFIGPIPPGVPGPYLWVETEIGPQNSMTIWIEDGT